MDLVGKVIALLPEVKMKSGKTKYGFVIETDGDYSQKIPFDVWGEERWQKLLRKDNCPSSRRRQQETVQTGRF